MESLEKKVKEELILYNPPIMINEYVDGREFTVGILGYRDDVEVLPMWRSAMTIFRSPT